MIHSFVYLFLTFIIISTRSASTRNILSHPKLYSYIETKHPNNLSKQATDNLKLILNFIQNSSEFQPLVFSIVQPEFQSNLVDILMKYIADNSIELYTAKTSDLSLKTTWINRVKLTWVIPVHDLYNLYIYIYWQPRLWNSSNQYLIIFLGEDTITSWEDVFKQLWKRYSVYRAVIISVQDDFRCLIKYMPFDKREDDFGDVYKLCSNDYQAPRNTSENIDAIERFQSNNRLFENFQNINNYPINVIVFESLLMNIAYDDQNRLSLSNLDANVLYILEKAMRAKFLIKAMRKRDFRPEDPFSVSLRSIQNGDTEMVITGFFVKLYNNFQKSRFTCAVYEDKLCFLAPDSGLVPKAYMPFLPFEKRVWFVLIVYNIGITIIWFFVNRINEHLQHPTHPKIEDNKNTPTSSFKIKRIFQIRTVLDHFNPTVSKKTKRQGPPEVPGYLSAIFLFLEILCYPLQKGTSPTHNCLLSATLFFSLIVNGLYQSCLVSSLNKPFHYPQLRSLEDVIDSGKPVITKYANLKTVFLDDSPLDRKLNERIRVISSGVSTKNIVAFEDKISITRYYGTILRNDSYFDKDGNDLLHVVDECPMNYRVSYVLRSSSPYANRVDFILLRVKEAGFLSFWFQHKLYPLKIHRSKRKLRMGERMMKLTLGHYSLTFLILFGGLFSSVLMFACEFYAGRSGSVGIN